MVLHNEYKLHMKIGGSLGIDTIGNKPIDEDIDLLPDTGGAVVPGISLILLTRHCRYSS